MSPTEASSAVFRAEIQDRVIEWDCAVLDEIRRAAVDGFNRFGHGGLEVGGILYGRREGDLIHVLSSREILCEHARGPGFLLSESDRTALAALLQPAEASTPEEAPVPVGWYCSHTRSGIALSLGDRELFRSFFPEPWQIAVIIKPSRTGAARVGVFTRDAEGTVRPHAQSDEFEIELPKRAVEHGGAGDSPQETTVELPARTEQTPVPIAGPPSKFRPNGWVSAAIPVAVVAAVLFAVLPSRHPDHPLGLRAYELARQLHIEWDRTSAAARDTVGGLLEINDGGAVTTVALDAQQIRSGSITYVQHSGDVVVRLHLDLSRRGKYAEEFTRFLGPPPVLAPVTQKIETAEKPDLSHVAGLGSTLPASPPRIAPVAPGPSQPPPSGTAERTPATAFVPDFPVAGDDTTQNPVFAPPPAITGPAGNSISKPPALIASLAAKPVPPAPTPPPAYTGPPTGRLIWTGQIVRGGVLEIDGAKASIGSFTGALPGAAIEISIHPAEFRSQGVIAYTADPTISDQVEKPARDNGWNATQMKWDPNRAAELAIIEFPGPQNNFRRLVLRNDGRTWSLLLIDWRVVTQKP